eukprot:4232080-Pyramimonas_sp.AAC.1
MRKAVNLQPRTSHARPANSSGRGYTQFVVGQTAFAWAETASWRILYVVNETARTMAPAECPKTMKCP